MTLFYFSHDDTNITTWNYYFVNSSTSWDNKKMECIHSNNSWEQNGIEMAVNISVFFSESVICCTKKKAIFNHFIPHTIHILTRQNLQRICTVKLSGGYRAAHRRKC